MLFPETTKLKLSAWAATQQENGMIVEQLREGCFSLDKAPKIDIPNGRVMSDVSSMFIVYLLEMYQWGAVEKVRHSGEMKEGNEKKEKKMIR